MRDHPIPPVSEPLQYRAIGLVRGKYLPESQEHFSKGIILDENGEKIDAVVLGRAIPLVRRRLTLDESHLWVVYPRARNERNLHLQISGIWEPSTLDNSNEKNHKGHFRDEVKEGDNYFSVRGELIFTKPETQDLIIKIKQKPRSNNRRSFPFKLALKGEISIESLRSFLSLDVRRVGQSLYVESQELIAKESK